METKRKIMFVTGGSYGIERMVTNLIGWLYGTGRWDIVAVLIRQDPEGYGDLPDGVEVQRIVKCNVSRGVLALTKAIQEESPDVIYSTQIHYSIATMLAWLLAGRKGKVVVSEHGCLMKEVEFRKGKRGVKLRVSILLARLLYRFAAKVHMISHRALENDALLLHLPEDKIAVLYDPTIDERVYRMAQEDCDHPWVKDRRFPVIVSVGRLSLQKGYRYLVRALAEVNAKLECCLIILGEGFERQMLQDLAKELGIESKIDFIGFRENPYPFMQVADLFVMSSLWEGFGIAHAEAMACGAPVVFTDCDNGPSEIVEDGVSGLLVPIQDVDALADAIFELLSDDAKRSRFSEAAKLRAREFSIEAQAPGYDDLFRSLIDM
ncbi:MAG: glycosyltransferase [Patescibacteria group bacterium]|nr:glycosyltransferase [Patescibacteria group bacterium]